MKKSSLLILVLLLLVAAGGWLVASQGPDKAKDPVCGMSVTKSTATYTYDYKGTTYYFCGESCKTSFIKDPEKYLAPGAETKPMGEMKGQGMMHGQMMQGQAVDPSKAKDLVCGMTVDKATAKWTYEYKGTTYYFCSEGCKTSFAKEPEKYLAAEAKPMAGMMKGQGMMHEKMAAGMEGMAGCPMMLPDVERKIETTKNGVVITLTSKNAETVKKIQEHAAKMKDMNMKDMKEMKKTPAAGPMAETGCTGCAGCATKK
ncbi:MAG: YHS domain-containing protein [Candidatus Aminicenantes bacterium]|nr:YHS domain-containing protein [Candidatus Aminicenantes bacterium]